MPALKNVKHEKFAQAIANGSTGVQAYKDEVSEGCTTISAMTQASRLLADVKISSRVAELQKLANDTLEKRLGWNKEKALTYLVEVLETPIGEVSKAHRLAQEYCDTEDRSQVKLPSKADALKQLAVMCGWNEPEKFTLDVEVRLGGNA
jgi:hypothetical protein